ncbi:MAG: hypothetical protein K5931_00290 [Lachnospiraceae bacterium]|nr:hypothetical protein [Lachnospiraceae bacterium]
MASNTWYKPDNVAKVFLASYNKRDTRSFRISVELKEEIEPEFLETAVKRALSMRPQYQVLIHKGVFWHYMDRTDIEPEVAEENDRPCPTLYGPSVKGKLHFKVSYWYNRINLDMFHALTDGNGGVEFLNLILLYYLNLLYPGKLSEVSFKGAGTASGREEDSFDKFFEKDGKFLKAEKLKMAYHMRGLKLPNEQLQFFEVHFPLKDLLKMAKENEATLTSYLCARLMLAIRDDMPLLQRQRPVTVSMPVNLRNFYDSSTSRNFFNSVYVRHVFNKDISLKDLCRECDSKLKSELTPEMIAKRMNNYEKIERLLFVRMVPLFIKNPVVNFSSLIENKGVTAVISNMGKISVPEELKPYIEGYSAYCSTQSFFITCLSYEEDFVMGIVSAYRNTGFLRNFISGFAEEGLKVDLYATDIAE